MNASEVKKAAIAQIETIAISLLPNFKKTGNVLSVGSIGGEPGHSLKLNINGRNAGLWKDWSCDSHKAKDIVDLVMQVKGLRYREAIKWLADFTGVTIEEYKRTRTPDWDKPKLEALVDIEPESLIGKWLSEERKIPLEVAKAYGVYRDERDRLAVMLHYLGEEACMVKAFYHPSLNKDSKCYSSTNPLHVLFGKHIATPDAQNILPVGSLVITEGQWDAMSYAAIGVPAASIPSGVENLSWIDNDWEYLQQFTTFYLSFDMDEAGRKGANAIATRLGYERCRNVKLPLKDANEMIKAGRADELALSLIDASEFSPDLLKAAGEFKHEVNLLINNNSSLDGMPFIWPDFPLRVRESELTVYTGYTGHGKSTLVQQVATYLISRGERITIASIESRPAKTLACMAKQLVGLQYDLKDAKQFEWAYKFIHERTDIYDDQDKVDPHTIIKHFTYALQRHGTRHFIIDNAMCLKIDRQDLEGQASAADEFRSFVRKHGVSLHLVTHPRKPPAGTLAKPPTVHEIRGASEWADMANNIVSVFRNMKKEDDLQDAVIQQADDITINQIKETVPDCIITVGKQRETGELPVLPTWFDKVTKRFILSPDELQASYI
jgi:twinkle protein